MALRIRFQYQTGSTLGYSIERLSDGLFYDNASGTFAASPTTPIAGLPEGAGVFLGSYSVTLNPTPSATFLDGDYAVRIHNATVNNVVIGLLPALMHGGNDATVFPSGAGSDPWATSLPGSYPPGTAGAFIGQNLDAKVSSRSTYAGGPVASVTAAVTVGTVADKTGYALASNGLDSIAVEAGINARQALSPILAASAGVVTGAGTGTIVVRGANTSQVRIAATTDNAGNRTSVNLSLPT